MNLHRRVAALEERLWVRIASEQTAREAEAQWNWTCAEDPKLASIVDRMCQAATSTAGETFDRSFLGRCNLSESRRFYKGLFAADGAAGLVAEFAEHVCGWKGAAPPAQTQPSLGNDELQGRPTADAAEHSDAARGEPPGTPG